MYNIHLQCTCLTILLHILAKVNLVSSDPDLSVLVKDKIDLYKYIAV